MIICVVQCHSFKKGKPVFIDKPLVGNLADYRKVQELAKSGAVILGASSARYAYEIQEFLAIPEEERGKTVQVFGTAGVDEFNYGIHIAEALAGILGSGFTSVHYLGRGQAEGGYSESYYLSHKNGASAIFNTFTGAWQPFVITIMTTKTTYHFKIKSHVKAKHNYSGFFHRQAIFYYLVKYRFITFVESNH